ENSADNVERRSDGPNSRYSVEIIFQNVKSLDRLQNSFVKHISCDDHEYRKGSFQQSMTFAMPVHNGRNELLGKTQCDKIGHRVQHFAFIHRLYKRCLFEFPIERGMDQFKKTFKNKIGDDNNQY